MKKIITTAAVGVTLLLLSAPAVFAAVERVDGFVCPVIKTENVLNSPNGGTLGDTGHYTIGGPDVMVPLHATNGDGTGVPQGPHSMPGDTDYTAIWADLE